jgi:two-component system response regulator HydG
VVPLQAPPLRERKEDIPLLAQHFLTRFNQRNGTRRTLTQGALQKMATYDFPGNVRELENVVEQAAALAHGDEIEADDVFLESPPAPPPDGSSGGIRTLGQEVDDAERRAIEAAMERNGGVIEKVARELDVSTTTLWRKMKRLGMRKE